MRRLLRAHGVPKEAGQTGPPKREIIMTASTIAMPTAKPTTTGALRALLVATVLVVLVLASFAIGRVTGTSGDSGTKITPATQTTDAPQCHHGHPC